MQTSWTPSSEIAAGGRLVAIGDALGMLHGAVKFRSKDPGINLIFMELALIFAPRGSTVEAVHIWSEENQLADVLSRCIAEQLPIPGILTKVPCTPVRDGGLTILEK